MKTILKQQNTLEAQLGQTISNYNKTSKNRRTSGYIKGKIETIKSLWERFDNNHLELGAADTSSIKDEQVRANVLLYVQGTQFQEFEKTYSEFMGELQDGLDAYITHKAEEENQKAQSREQTSAPKAILKLPTIEIPKFDGQYTSWRTFHDRFVSLIHNEERLTPVDKLHYLKNSLMGEARRDLDAFDMTSENYAAAWELLCNRYNKRRLLIYAQFKLLFNQSKIKNESYKEIRSMLDELHRIQHGLQVLKVNITNWDPIFVYITAQRLPDKTRNLWEQLIAKSDELPSLDELSKFMEERYRSLEATKDINQGMINREVRKGGKDRNKTTSYHISQHNIEKEGRDSSWRENDENYQQKGFANNPNKLQQDQGYKGQYRNTTFRRIHCPMCRRQHFLSQCMKFKGLDINTKRKWLAENKLCDNCLRSHPKATCVSNNKCPKCGKRHHILLHDGVSPEDIKRGINKDTKEDPKEQSVTNCNYNKNNTQSMLATALVKIKDHHGTYLTLRALIDPGSQSSFITETAYQSLQAETISTSLKVTGLTSAQVATSNKIACVSLLSTIDPTYERTMQAYVIKSITNIFPPKRFEWQKWSHIDGLELADPKYAEQGRIDVLLGVDIYADIIQNDLRKGVNQSPVAQKTTLGWILFGESATRTPHPTQSNFSAFTLHQKDTLQELSQQMKKFWEWEELDTGRRLTAEEEQCEQHYEKHTKRHPNGHYEVSIPFVGGNLPVLGDSKGQAMSRLIQTERKLAQNVELKKAYTQCLREYIDLGHMKAVNEQTSHRYYMPHHAVVKESTTTKVRVVFDASAKTSNKKSLNEQMLNGPTLQPKLFATLLNWRRFKYAVTADIEKMYRMISVSPADRKYQTILWRENPEEPVQEYELQTVTFGTTAAPYLAIKTLQRLANDEMERYPKAARTAFTDFYVDDVLTGADTLPEALELQRELNDLLRCGGFHLRKWAANHQSLLEAIPAEDRELQLPLKVQEDDQIKALGIYWHPVKDYFSYAINESEFAKPATTKRRILSEVAKLYDPLGWIAPCIVVAKLIMQRLWMNGYEWDDPVDQEIHQEWSQFKEQLPYFQKLKIPRWVNTSNKNKSSQLVGFCDASIRAYAAVVYIRTILEDESIKTTLLMARTRVAPIKPMSLPRLELCGAVLLSKLIRQIKIDMQLQDIQSKCWTDSKVVLAWLKGLPNKWKTFVANRTVEISENTENTSWHYVSTKENPADLASRGITPSKLEASSIWWHGPNWLQKPEENWPKEYVGELNTDLEAKNITKSMITNEPIDTDWWMRFSSLTKTLRVMAYCYRFIYNCRKKKDRRDSQLLAEEIERARMKLVQLAQRQMFPKEYELLSTRKTINKQSQLAKLCPFMAEDGTIRVGGRLQKSSLSYDVKHPMIMQRRHHITNLIIDYFHKTTLHGGAQLVLNTIRNQYWITNGMLAVKERLSKCVTCIRYRATAPSQIMGNLPSARITPANPFENVGVDYAGPIELKMSKHKGSKVYKGYFCIFICMCTKAIHIEVASDMTTEAFIAALRRFTGRRGLCRNIYSDNGTNFVGANKQLQSQMKQVLKDATTQVADELASQNIQWHFNPPITPHFGGLWEAGVKSIKHHLRRINKDKILTFEELTTLLIQIEACLNSRPLCQLSADPSNLEILTPGHFLIGRNLKAIPEPKVDDNRSYLDRWKYIQQLLQQFWSQWSQDYLLELQKRSKWLSPQPNLNIGQVVIIMDHNRSPSQWPLGVIHEIHPGADKQVRVVSVRTASATVKRPIHKLCPLSA